MRLKIQSMLAIALLLILPGSRAFADSDKVLKVYILKTHKVSPDAVPGPYFNIRNVELALPTDDEMKLLRKSIGDSGMNLEDLKIGQAFPYEMFILEVKKPYQDQPVKKEDRVNGIPVLKPSEAEIDQQEQGLKTIKEAYAFLDNMEIQFGGGGAPTLSDGLSHSYHTGNYLFGGFGYQFSRNFAVLMNLEGGAFPSSSDGRTHGYDMEELTLELLAKYRITATGIRPYLFAGPAITETSFSTSFTYKSFDGSQSYRDQSHFTMVGGAGVEFPFGKGHFFIQSELLYDTLPDDTANFSSLDKNISVIPIEIGLVRGR